MKNALKETNYKLPEQSSFYKGKVRDVYTIADKYLLMVVSDRISAFDVVMPQAIPHKGQVLNQIASLFLDATEDIVPNWKIANPDPMVTFGRYCEPFAIEMVIRGYLTGHAWREYKSGKREICGVPLPDGMKEHQRFEKPIITPTTKATEGHDMDISKEEIIRQGIVSVDDYEKLEDYTYRLFKRGTEMAKEQNLILVDTKYEFGKQNEEIFLIDEIHTPDSSRYFYLDTYQNNFNNDKPQKQLSKEFVREWLIENGFQGKTGQSIPKMTDEFIHSVSERYIELYEKITGKKFEKAAETEDISQRVEDNMIGFLKKYLS